jgi:DNA-3-methyladenine glycosylase
MPRLTRRFFRRDPISLARALLGQTLVRILDDGSRLAGRIVETEAYLGAEDAAAHSYKGRRTDRVKSMYLDGGHAYVYFTYGMHHCLNIVADRAGTATACLLRAIEPLEGLETMRRNRAVKIPAAKLKDAHLGSGPAKLAQALAIDRRLDGEDLVTSARLFLERGRAVPDPRIVAAPRIGVGYAGEWAHKPLRFFEAGNAHVSGPRAK